MEQPKSTLEQAAKQKKKPTKPSLPDNRLTGLSEKLIKEGRVPRYIREDEVQEFLSKGYRVEAEEGQKPTDKTVIDGKKSIGGEARSREMILVSIDKETHQKYVNYFEEQSSFTGAQIVSDFQQKMKEVGGSGYGDVEIKEGKANG